MRFTLHRSEATLNAACSGVNGDGFELSYACESSGAGAVENGFATAVVNTIASTDTDVTVQLSVQLSAQAANVYALSGNSEFPITMVSFPNLASAAALLLIFWL